MFNLEQAIQSWKHSLKESPAFEEGQIKEMETHLCDEIDYYIDAGYNTEEAFNKAVANFGPVEELGDEVYKTKTTNKVDATPPWKKRSWIPTLLPNFFKVSLRNLKRDKESSIINIGGLAIGLIFFSLISLYVMKEKSYDRFHDNPSRIYRLITHGTPPGGEEVQFATTSRPMGSAIRNEYPEVETLARMYPADPVVRHNNQYHFNEKFYYAEPEFLQIFNFPLVAGDMATALQQPYSLVITEEMRAKYFGPGEALGQTLILNDSTEYQITGVMENIPDNSHFNFDFLISYATLEQNSSEGDAWLSLLAYTYIMLREGNSEASFEKKISDLVDRHYGKVMEKIGFAASVKLQAVTDIHLYSHLNNEMSANGNAQYVFVFAILAIFILVLACVNYINLSTARYIERAREVGIRKIMGSTRRALIGQYLSESFIYTCIALILSLSLISLLLPIINELLGISIDRMQLLDNRVLLGSGVLVMIVTLLAGFYPAITISGYNPVRTLSSADEQVSGRALLRKSLVIFQFAISFILVIASLVVYSQFSFMVSGDPGFNKEQVLVVDARGVPGKQLGEKYTILKERFLNYPSVKSASASSTIPGREGYNIVTVPEDLPEGQSRRMEVVMIDHDYFETMELNLIAGRDFSREYQTDSKVGVLINEAAVKAIGYESPQDALNSKIQINNKKGTVVGVIEDYYHNSLKTKAGPMLFHIHPNLFDYLSLRFKAENVTQLIASLESEWVEQYPGYAFNYFFLDEDFSRQYLSEEKLMKLLGLFSLLAIIVASLGLYGLVAFMTRRRIREIGIRKVLGATTASIVTLLSKHFLILILISFVISIPVAWYGINQWLADYAQRIELGVGIFLMAAVVVVSVSLITICWQSLKVVVANPADSLRSE